MTEKQPNDFGRAMLDERAKVEVLRVAFVLFMRMQPPETRATLCDRLTRQIAEWQELGLATENPDLYLELLGQHADRLRSMIEE